MAMQKYPSMKSAVMAWATKTKVFIIAKKQIDFKTVESHIETTAMVFRNPTGQRLEMKPEGQRRWNTEKVYAETALELKIDDIIIFDCVSSKKFRVVGKTDWTQFGYIEYDLLSDYI